MRRLFSLAVAILAARLLFAAETVHARFGADAFNRAVSVATSGNAVFSPYSFEINSVALSDAFDPIVKAHFAETIGVLSDLEEIYGSIFARMKSAATNRFSVVTARAFCLPETKMANVPYRCDIQRVYSMEVCPGIPATGAERWLRAAVDGDMEDFSIPLGTVTRDTYALYDLVSVRFSWKNPFPKANTRKLSFVHEDGTRSEVEAMCDLRNVDVWRNRRFSLMRLPLADQAWFYAMLPAEGVSVGDIRGELSSQTIDNLLSVMKSVTITGVSHDPVAVAVPKMDVTTELDLSGVYQYFKLPLKGFARMDSAMRPSAVRQRVRLRVDEQGLDPAPLDIKPESEVVRAVENTQRFILNRPFLFFVYHEPTGMIPVAGQFTGM